MTRPLPLLHDLLIGGGDERLDLDADGRNRYGHDPLPRPDDLAFGSSTASTISADAHAWLERHHAILSADVARRGLSHTHRNEAAAIRNEIITCLGAESRPPHVILAASGTDIHLIATALVSRPDQPMLAVSLSEHETGSGVAAAIAGRHFAFRTASGLPVSPGTSALDASIEHLVLQARQSDGSVRPSDEIADELDRHLTAAVREGRHCLLVLTDVSKTGLLLPELDVVLSLKRRFGDRLKILVDACQFRLLPSTVRAYLDQGFLVAISGSKFLGGPVFSGALLCPPGMGGEVHGVPRGLGLYTGKDNWPGDWPGREVLPPSKNFGLLFRWRAALFEWQQLGRVPSASLASSARLLAHAVRRQIAAYDSLVDFTVADLDRSALKSLGGTAGMYDAVPTIFPFGLRFGDHRGNRSLSVAQCRTLWHELARPSCSRPALRLGQPVAISSDGTASVGALRLCFNASQIASASSDPQRMQRLIDDARLALAYVVRALATEGHAQTCLAA